MLGMKVAGFRVAMQLRLTLLPANAAGLQYPCRAVTMAADCDHAMMCASTREGYVAPRPFQRDSTPFYLPDRDCHHYWRQRCTGCQARCGAPASATAGLEAREDILVALGSGLAIMDREKCLQSA